MNYHNYYMYLVVLFTAHNFVIIETIIVVIIMNNIL